MSDTRDITERLRDWHTDPDDVLHPAADTIDALRAEVAAERARADMHADLGRRTAEALGLDPSDGRSDMPERVAALTARAERAEAERDALRADAERWAHVWRCVRMASTGDYVVTLDEPTGMPEDSIARSRFRRGVDEERAREATL